MEPTLSNYNKKIKDSFNTKVKAYFFSCVIKEEQPTTEPFKNFSISEVKNDYINKYYQYNYKEHITDTLTVEKIYEKMKAFLDDKTLLDDLFKAYTPPYSFDQFKKTLEQKHCYYCGVTSDEIERLAKQGKLFRKANRGWKLELERFDSNEEYSAENCTMVCYWCNNAKTDEFTKDEFMPIGQQIRSIWEERLRTPLKNDIG